MLLVVKLYDKIINIYKIILIYCTSFTFILYICFVVQKNILIYLKVWLDMS